MTFNLKITSFKQEIAKKCVPYVYIRCFANARIK